MAIETIYGFFPGGDPRDFTPDEESCTEAELTAHREACRLADEAEKVGQEHSESPACYWTQMAGGAAHVNTGKFGIGTYEIEVEL
jgi:hypothetical protein